MIISHRHRFIFLKTAKTGSSAFELALARHCGPDDVLTALGKEEAAYIRAARLPIPQNNRLPFARYRARQWLRLPLRGCAERFDSHASAVEVRAEIGAEVWDGYFKFAVVRNPWDRYLSWYHWHYRRLRRRLLHPLTVREFIDHHRTAALQRLGWGLYTIDGANAVDHVLRYERLPEELAFLQRKLGLQAPLAMPRTKHDTRSDRRPYREVLSAEDGARLAEIFAPEISRFGYSF